MTRPSGKKVLLTAVGPSMERELKFARPTYQQFAETSGYELVVKRFDIDGPGRLRETRMFKVGLIQEQLAKGADLVFWIDADAHFRRYDADPADYLEPEHFQGLVLEHVPLRKRVNPNSGVWLIRNCPEADAFLRNVQRIGLTPGRHWADQDAIMQALAWYMGKEDYVGAQPGAKTTAFRHTTWLPLTFNTLFYDGRPKLRHWEGMPAEPNPHILHLAGLTSDERAEVLPGLFDEAAEAVNQ